MESGRPSRTAEYVALFRALESLRPAGERQFLDPQATRFLRPTLRLLACAARLRPLRARIETHIDRRWPGPRPSAIARTRVIDEFVTDALSDGCVQVVLLGAGYDTRASRLRALAGVPVYEVDHPATQARKRKALAASPANVRYVAVDFERDRLDMALSDAGLDPKRLAAVVWEGVFSYLSVDSIDRTIRSLTATCAPGSRLLLTYVDQAALDDEGSRELPWLQAVNRAGEPFRTGLAPELAGEFFHARGLTLRHDESTSEAARRIGVGGTMPGFYRLATLELAAPSPGQG